MSQVHRLSAAPGSQFVAPVEEADWDVLATLSGADAPDPWPAIAMEVVTVDEDGAKLAPSELPWLSHYALVLADDAIEAVGPLLEPYGTLHELSCAAARLVVFEARLLSGAVDKRRSRITRFADSGAIMTLEPAFHDDAVAGAGAFKIAEMPASDDLYLTADLVAAIRATGHASGVEFTPVEPPTAK